MRPKKQLGQNFLTDPAIPRMIVNRTGISAEDIVLEIGAGLGALTVPAARAAKRVYAVETDRRLIDLLETELLLYKTDNVTVMKQDILKFDLADFVQREGIARPLVVIGNLPYHISSQIVVRLIDQRRWVDRAAVMFQKELARRFMARPGGKDYGRLTVMLAYCAEVRSLSEVKADLFFPKPKIDSEVIEIRFRKTLAHPAPDEAFLFKVIKAGFGQRRKTLRNALAGSELRIAPDAARRALEAAGINASRRAETLSVGEFVALSRVLRDAAAEGALL
jgi:16S rRNA (adenine1518-N6/adenine1519-N6)-dimethyltransferase